MKKHMILIAIIYMSIISCNYETSPPKIVIEMVSVPGGTFQWDSTPTNLSTVSPFLMSQTEITRAQFSAVMGTDPSKTDYSSGTSDPVQSVSWYHAIAFCNKLSLLDGLIPVYEVSGVNFRKLKYSDVPDYDNATWNAAVANWSADGYRLPTVMEWMWAAMGADSANPGVVNTTGYYKAFAGYNGYNNMEDYVWYEINSNSTTHSAGSKLPNELGLYDMSGNVLEWTWDAIADYPGNVARHLRGGWFDSDRHSISLPTGSGGQACNPGVQFGIRVVRRLVQYEI